MNEPAPFPADSLDAQEREHVSGALLAHMRNPRTGDVQTVDLRVASVVNRLLRMGWTFVEETGEG